MRLPLLAAAALLAVVQPAAVQPAVAQTPLTGTTPPTTGAPPLAGTAAQPGTFPATAPAANGANGANGVSGPGGANGANGADGADATPRSHRRTLAARFGDANTTHDGKLTLEQARAAHMNAVVRDFSAIDKTSRGYVTLADIRIHNHEARAARRAAGHAGQGGQHS